MSLYWHGGKPGLNPGDVLKPEPHFVDGCPVCAAKKRGQSTLVDPIPEHQEEVYMTSDRLYARFHASKYPRGDLYSVEPIGEAQESTEDPFPSYRAATARVVRVYERYIALTMKERRSLYRRWKAADEERRGGRDLFADHALREFERTIGL